MYRLSYLLLQGFFLLVSHEELTVLDKGALFKVDAFRTEYSCLNDFMYINCSPPKVIKIFVARYSPTEKHTCREWRNKFNSAEICGRVDKTHYLRKICEGHTECNVTVDTNTMGDQCPGMLAPKYLHVIYGCKIMKPPPTPSVYHQSTMVLTKPSSPSPPFTHSTEGPTQTTARPYSTTIDDNEDDDDSTSAVYGFVIYNGESVNRISGVLIAFLLGIGFL